MHYQMKISNENENDWESIIVDKENKSVEVGDAIIIRLKKRIKGNIEREKRCIVTTERKEWEK